MTPSIAQIRADFPALAHTIEGRRLSYLDNAATTQKPNRVIDAIGDFYRAGCANVHRGVHALGWRTSEAYEHARERVRRFIHAADASEILFTSGTTEAVNAVADGLRRRGLRASAEIVVSALEHHSNFLPWQRLCSEVGARLIVVPCGSDGRLDLSACAAALNPRTALVACTHVSNVLGTVQPVEELVQIAKRQAALVFIDGAQALPHRAVDVSALGADFYAFSAHKLYGPFGIGVLYAKAEAQERLPPYQTGGGMVQRVEEHSSSFAPSPARYEAGTPDVAGAIGLAAALDYLDGLGQTAREAHERGLLEQALETLAAVSGVRLLCARPDNAGIVSFTVNGVHPHDLATVLDRNGVAVRAGHHCAQPLLRQLGVPGTVRASLGVYNDRDDVEALAAGVREALEVLRR